MLNYYFEFNSDPYFFNKIYDFLSDPHESEIGINMDWNESIFLGLMPPEIFEYIHSKDTNKIAFQRNQ